MCVPYQLVVVSLMVKVIHGSSDSSSNTQEEGGVIRKTCPSEVPGNGNLWNILTPSQPGENCC